ncbi:MAG: ABC transporter ATP-binding protein [bacterium]
MFKNFKKVIEDKLRFIGYNQNVKEFFKNLKIPYLELILIILSTILFNITTALQPVIFSKLFDIIYQYKSFYYLNLLVLVTIVLFILRGVSQYSQSFLLTKANLKILTDLQKRIFYKIIVQPLSKLDKKNSGELYSITISYIGAIASDLTPLLLTYINSLFILVFVLIWIFYKDIILGIITIIGLPFIGYTLNYYIKKIGNTSDILLEKISALNSKLVQNYRMIKFIKSFNKEEFEKQNIYQLLDNILNLRLKLANILSLQKPVTEIVASLSLIVISWYGGYLVIKGVFKPSDILIYWGYVAISVSPITNLSASLVNTKIIFGYIDTLMNIFKELNENEFDDQKYVINEDIDIKGKIEFKDVYFGYNQDQLILEGVNLLIDSGQKVAIVGKTGIGKTSIISLLTKFYLPNNGKILIDDMDLSVINPKIIRNKIGILTQEYYLIEGSIIDNLRYAKDNATFEEIVNACKLAQIHEDIIKLPNGYDTIISEDGKTLSGGQKQRINLARIFLKNPDIIILDEPTSALDPITEKIVISSIENYFNSKTVIIISHKPITLNFVDKIYTIENKKLKEISYNELLKLNMLV